MTGREFEGRIETEDENTVRLEVWCKGDAEHTWLETAVDLRDETALGRAALDLMLSAKIAAENAESARNAEDPDFWQKIKRLQRGRENKIVGPMEVARGRLGVRCEI